MNESLRQLNESLPLDHYVFKMGVMRAKARFNHHTRRQARKATDQGLLGTFAAGWYIQKMLHLLFVANN